MGGADEDGERGRLAEGLEPSNAILKADDFVAGLSIQLDRPQVALGTRLRTGIILPRNPVRDRL